MQFIDPDFSGKVDLKNKLNRSNSYRTEENNAPLKIIAKEMEIHYMIAEKGALKFSTEMELGLLDL